MKARMSLLTVLIGVCTVLATALPAVGAAPLHEAANHRGAHRAAWPGLTSSNWSGYATTTGSGHKLTYASATWKVPTVQHKTGYSSSWVGIDGFDNSSLIQTGTEQDFVHGKAVYRAWWEIIPAPETVIPSLTISPGDTMSAFVKNTAGNQWTISITDVTTGKSFSIKKTFTGPGRSAEWIQEAPSSSATHVLKLAHYSKTTFSKLQVGVDHAAAKNATLLFPGSLSAGGAIAMVQNGKQVSTPSKPSGNSFAIAYGKKQPPAP